MSHPDPPLASVLPDVPAPLDDDDDDVDDDDDDAEVEATLVDPADNPSPVSLPSIGNPPVGDRQATWHSSRANARLINS